MSDMTPDVETAKALIAYFRGAYMSTLPVDHLDLLTMLLQGQTLYCVLPHETTNEALIRLGYARRDHERCDRLGCTGRAIVLRDVRCMEVPGSCTWPVDKANKWIEDGCPAIKVTEL